MAGPHASSQLPAPRSHLLACQLQAPSPQLFNAWLARIASQLQASWFPTDQRLLPDSHLPTPTTIFDVLRSWACVPLVVFLPCSRRRLREQSGPKYHLNIYFATALKQVQMSLVFLFGDAFCRPPRQTSKIHGQNGPREVSWGASGAPSGASNRSEALLATLPVPGLPLKFSKITLRLGPIQWEPFW